MARDKRRWRERSIAHRDEDAGSMTIKCDIWQDQRFISLTWTAQWLFFGGLMHMVDTGQTDLIDQYFVDGPARKPDRERLLAAGELVAAGVWEPVALGYTLTEWFGCFVSLGLCRRPIPVALRQAIYARDGHQCVECGTDEWLSLDHIKPWSRGGPDTYDNLRTLCRSCNSRKGARY